VIGEPKSEASHRTIKVPAPIPAMLAEHMEGVPDDPEAFVFTTKRGLPIRHNQFYKKVFKPVVTGRKEIPARVVRNGNSHRIVPGKPAIVSPLPAAKRKLRWHDVRHTCAALSLAVAPNLYLVKERLGHEDIRTTINTYGHLLPEVDTALADGLRALFESDNVVLLSERQALAAVCATALDVSHPRVPPWPVEAFAVSGTRDWPLARVEQVLPQPPEEGVIRGLKVGYDVGHDRHLGRRIEHVHVVVRCPCGAEALVDCLVHGR